MAFRADLNTFPDFGAMTAVVSVAEVGIAWTRALLWRKRVMARLAVNKRRVIARDISDLVTSRRDSREKRVWGETREKETGERRQKKTCSGEIQSPLYLREIMRTPPEFRSEEGSDPYVKIQEPSPRRQANHKCMAK